MSQPPNPIIPVGPAEPRSNWNRWGIKLLRWQFVFKALEKKKKSWNSQWSNLFLTSKILQKKRTQAAGIDSTALC